MSIDNLSREAEALVITPKYTYQLNVSWKANNAESTAATPDPGPYLDQLLDSITFTE